MPGEGEAQVSNVLGRIQRKGTRAEGTYLPSMIFRTVTLAGIFDYRQSMFRCNFHDFIHCAG